MLRENQYKYHPDNLASLSDNSRPSNSVMQRNQASSPRDFGEFIGSSFNQTRHLLPPGYRTSFQQLPSSTATHPPSTPSNPPSTPSNPPSSPSNPPSTPSNHSYSTPHYWHHNPCPTHTSTPLLRLALLTTIPIVLPFLARLLTTAIRVPLSNPNRKRYDYTRHSY